MMAAMSCRPWYRCASRRWAALSGHGQGQAHKRCHARQARGAEIVRILVTGGCGFIGSNFIRYLLHQSAGNQVVNLDALTYAGNPANLEDLQGERRYTFVRGDICDRVLVDEVMAS